MFVLIIIATIVSSIVFSIIDITNPFLRDAGASDPAAARCRASATSSTATPAARRALLSRALRWPGLMVQHLTVFEPDDSMIEVAITGDEGGHSGRRLGRVVSAMH